MPGLGDVSNLVMHLPAIPSNLPATTGVRTLRPDEDVALAALLDAAFEEAWDVARVHAALLDDSTVDQTYVIANGNQLLATASARYLPDDWPDDGYLHWVGVHPDARGHGLGSQVVVAVLRHFAGAGRRGSILETEDHRLAAIKTYLRLGYVPRYRNSDPSEFAEQESRWSAILPRLLRARPG